MSFSLSSLLGFVTMSALLVSAAMWAAEGGQVGNVAGVLLYLAPSLLTLVNLDQEGRAKPTAIPMLIAMLPVLAGAAAVYAWRLGEPGLIAPVLLFIWGLQMPIVALALKRRAPARPDRVPLLDVMKPARIAVDIPRIGPAFDLPLDRWPEVRAALAPPFRVESSVSSPRLGSITIEQDDFRRTRIELFEGQSTCEFSVSGTKYRTRCPPDILLNVLSQCMIGKERA